MKILMIGLRQQLSFNCSDCHCKAIAKVTEVKLVPDSTDND